MFAEGGCSCGAVRYRLLERPIIVHACHCLDCQRLTGAAYATNAWIEKDRVEVTGSLATYRRAGGSGAEHRVYFCAACSTMVMNDYRRVPGEFWFVRVGTLDQPQLLSPDIHIHTRRKHPAVVLPTDAVAFEVSYDRAKVWPPDALARVEANIAAHPVPKAT